MGILSILVAAVAAFAFGAVYYMVLSKPWMAASGVPQNDQGQPINSSSPVPYLVSFVCIMLVAGMMRHTFALSGIDTVAKGVMSGFGIGLFFITPWIFLNIGYSARPWRLGVIDGGYATAACTIIGGVLVLI